MRRWAGYIWAGAGSLLGLALIATARAGVRVRRVQGALEAWGGDVLGIPARLLGEGLEAITLGHVILARDEASLERYREHERVHVRQWSRWGPFFLLAYPAASLWAWARGRAAYRGNRFEREAWQVGPRGVVLRSQLCCVASRTAGTATDIAFATQHKFSHPRTGFRQRRASPCSRSCSGRCPTSCTTRSDRTWPSVGSSWSTAASKARLCPLWTSTASALKTLVAGRNGSDPVFLNRRREGITRFGVYALVKRYVARAAHRVPSLPPSESART